MLKPEHATESFVTIGFYFLFTLQEIQARESTQQLLDATVVIYFEFWLLPILSLLGNNC